MLWSPLFFPVSSIDSNGVCNSVGSFSGFSQTRGFFSLLTCGRNSQSGRNCTGLEECSIVPTGCSFHKSFILLSLGKAEIGYTYMHFLVMTIGFLLRFIVMITMSIYLLLRSNERKAFTSQIRVKQIGTTPVVCVCECE